MCLNPAGKDVLQLHCITSLAQQNIFITDHRRHEGVLALRRVQQGGGLGFNAQLLRLLNLALVDKAKEMRARESV